MLYLKPGALHALLITACSVFLCVSAATHYCQQRSSSEIDIAKRQNADETLVAMHGASCKWIFTCAGLTNGPVRLVLQGKPINNSNNSMQYQLQKKVYNVPAGLMHGLTLYDDSCRIPVSYNRSFQQPPGSIPASLRVVILHPRYCARDFLNFRNSCYAVSAGTENFADAMHSIRGTARLASFISDAEISKFIASNTAGAKSYPYQPPLDLNRPARIGLFYTTQNDTVLSLAWNHTGCWLRPAPNLKKFRVVTTSGVTGGVLCASLKLSANSSIATNSEIDFVDCSTPMHSLVDFPEVRTAALSCNLSELLQEAAAHGQRREQPAQEQPLEQASISGSKSFEWILILLFLLATVLGIIICIVLKRHGRFGEQQMQLETGSPDSQQLNP